MLASTTAQSALDFHGGLTSETMPQNIVSSTVNPSKEVLVVRQAVWEGVVNSVASKVGVLGQPARDAMNVIRGDLLFTDRQITSTGDYMLAGASASIVFNSMTGISFLLRDVADEEYNLTHNSSLSKIPAGGGGGPPTAVSKDDTYKYMNQMLRERYEDLRFAGVAQSIWAVDDLRQSNAGISMAHSGTIAIINSTGHPVRMGQLLCLRMPQWEDQYGPKQRPGRLYADSNHSQDLILSGISLNHTGRPTLKLYSPVNDAKTQVANTLVSLREALRAIRAQVEISGREFGGRMRIVRDDVRTGMLDQWLAGAPLAVENPQEAVNSSGAAAGAFRRFTNAWDSIRTIVEELAKTVPTPAWQDVCLCILTEFLRIHDSVWHEIANVVVGGVQDPSVEMQFFDPPPNPITPVPQPLPPRIPRQEQRFTDYDQGVRQELNRIMVFHIAEVAQNGTFFNTATNNPAVAATITAARTAEATIRPGYLEMVVTAALYTNAKLLVTQLLTLRANIVTLVTLGTANRVVLDNRDSRAVRNAAEAVRLQMLEVEVLNASLATPNTVSVPAISAGATRLRDVAAAARTGADIGNNGDRRNALAARTLVIPSVDTTSYAAQLERIRQLVVAAEQASAPAPGAPTPTMQQVIRAIRDARRRQAVATAANVPAPAPPNTAQNARTAVIPDPSVRQNTVLDRLFGTAVTLGDVAEWREIIRAEHQAMFDLELARIRDEANEHLRVYLRPWDAVMQRAFDHVRRLFGDMSKEEFLNTVHGQLLFHRQPLDGLIRAPAIRVAFEDRVLPDLYFAPANLDTDPFFFRTWMSLERSQRRHGELVRDLLAGPAIAPIVEGSDLFRDPTNAANILRISAVVEDCMRLYMIYNDSILANDTVPAPFAPNFAPWNGRALLSTEGAKSEDSRTAGRWFEQPLFKAVDGADPDTLMRVTIIG